MDKKEIKSLISLLDDPDHEIFQHVEEQLITLGSNVIEHLESVWENSFDALQQIRIENIIQKIQVRSVSQALEIWKLMGAQDLLQGLIILNRHQYPDLNEAKLIGIIDEMVQTASHGTSLTNDATVNVNHINHVLYNDFGLSGNTSNYHDPQNSFINKVLETRKGNPILLSCIYSIVAQKLGLPIYGVNLPKHFILAYTTPDIPISNRQQILMYINAFNRGQVFGRDDVTSFLRQLELAPDDQFVLPCDNVSIITRVLRNLSSSYSQIGNLQKKNEIDQLLKKLMED